MAAKGLVNRCLKLPRAPLAGSRFLVMWLRSTVDVGSYSLDLIGKTKSHAYCVSFCWFSAFVEAYKLPIGGLTLFHSLTTSKLKDAIEGNIINLYWYGELQHSRCTFIKRRTIYNIMRLQLNFGECDGRSTIIIMLFYLSSKDFGWRDLSLLISERLNSDAFSWYFWRDFIVERLYFSLDLQKL